ncbi:hypothetical protein [Thioclava sp. JE_KL1]|uniref:hypothetical protein n=1 Tax=Thioclava sp. JE_KL1 TaxID=2651187 RepID=UPI00128BA3CD|nr:hypothetical protein [Thioclava sp. JE_KL1]MPQ96222.1 hypothetical protein [Thioclava sp. JE_KL1]
MKELGEVFLSRGVAASADQIKALQAVADCLGDMAEGRAAPRLHVSSLDPGMGKTTLLARFLHEVSVSPDHDDVGLVVFVSRLDEIERLVSDADLHPADFAVLTSNPGLNRLSPTQPNHAQILFTTQQMLARRCSGGVFRHCGDFHFHGKVRQVRLWDEGLDPQAIATISSDELGGVLPALREVSVSLADWVQRCLELLLVSPEAVYHWPRLPEGLRFLVLPRELPDHVRDLVAKVMGAAGRPVRVLPSSGQKKIALNIRDALPEDFAPALILDASARVRTSYREWQRQSAGPVLLPSAAKSYAPLTLHLLDQGGGKFSWQENGDQLAREIATIIDSKPDEPWLVIHHKAFGKVAPEQLIKAHCQTEVDRVEFLSWGSHRSTNAFHHVPNVIVAGLMHLPESQLRGLAYASSGLPVTEELPEGLVEEIELGELGDILLQAVGRGRARGCAGGRCLPCDAHIIAAPRYGLREALPGWFPDARIATWNPKHKPLRGSLRDAVGFIEARLAKYPTAPIHFTDLMEVTGYRDRSNFNKRIRRHKDMKAAIERLGLIEVSIHSPRGCDAFQRIFGPLKSASYISG